MNIGKLFGGDHSARLRKEASEARKAIEQAPQGDSVQISGDTTLVKPQGEIWQGRSNGKTMTAVKADKNSTVVLREEIIKEDNRGLQVAAGIAGTLIGAALFGGKKKDSLGAALGGLLVGGLAAWGAGKASDRVKEKRIERVETTPEGVTNERLREGRDGDNSYTSNFKRTAPPPPFDERPLKSTSKICRSSKATHLIVLTVYGTIRGGCRPAADEPGILRLFSRVPEIRPSPGRPRSFDP